jgi:putative DNA primase/helicase
LAARQISTRLSDAVILRVDDLPESADAADIDPPTDPAQWLRARLPSRPEDTTTIAPVDTSREIAAPPDQIAIRVVGLGYDHGRWYYYSSATRQITILRANDHTRQQLSAMAPTAYWYRAYQHHCGESGSLSWPEVAADLMADCRAAGVYDPDRVRGRGVWYDDKKIIAHLGDRLILDGSPVPLILPKSRYIYEVARPLLPEISKMPLPLTAREAVGLEKICRALRWEQASAGRMLAGWLVLATICGALTWRPSVWITGGAGSGKTWISRHIIRQVLGFASLYVSLSTTEPSIRRLLGADALPVIWGEGEPDTPAAVARLTAILGLVRQGSTESDSIIARAAPDGGVDTYKIRTMMCFQSVNAPVWTQADISRIEILSLRDHSIAGDISFQDLRARR